MSPDPNLTAGLVHLAALLVTAYTLALHTIARKDHHQ